METSPLFARTFDFVSWLLPRTQSFPRPQRFTVTQRLQNAALDFQELIVEAETARGAARLERLRQADAALGKVRLYLRLCREWDWLTSGQYQHAAQMVAEMGRLLGGWIKFRVLVSHDSHRLPEMRLGSNRPSRRGAG